MAETDLITTSQIVPPQVPQRSRLSRTACERCRKQKLRCSREQPTCNRCLRLSGSCNYPKLADRRVLAAQREAARRVEISSLADTIEPNVAAPVATNDFPAVSTQASQPSHVDIGSSDLPPRAIGLGLLDIYFERLYNAPLLFRKSDLFESYLNNSTPSFLLKALFALASRFLQAPPSDHRLSLNRPPIIPAELTMLSSYRKHGKSWAEAAAMEVLQLADRPTVQSIQTLASLSIYWFSRRDSDRARIFIAIAYTSCSNFLPLKIPTGEEQGQAGALAKEEIRACFWACWASICAAAMPEAYALNAWAEASRVPLPLPWHEYQLNSILNREYMDEEWNCRLCQQENEGRVLLNTGSSETVMGKTLKMMGIWARVQVIVRRDIVGPSTSQLKTLAATAKHLFNPQQLSPSFADNGSQVQDHARLLGMHSLYHLCRMVALSPLVTIFSGRRLPTERVESTTRAYAEAVADHALQHCQLVHAYVLKSHDITKISSLTAFASFVATSILATLVKSRIRRHHDMPNDFNQMLRQVLIFLRDSVDILDILQLTWEPLRPMAEVLHQRLRSLPTMMGENATCNLSESPRPLRIPVTGFNSPIPEGGSIPMTYVDSGSHSTVLEDDTQPSPIIGQGGVRINSNHAYEDIIDNESTIEFPAETGPPDASWPVNLFGTDNDILNLDNVSDWDFDLLTLYSARDNSCV
ncbi:hypothetical protein BU24DRAFT_467649 [Aaosphaeria arxii CBS 175.79]|uniref:Zn(2)-C6 fungal-type domain-containing protein n=1 Tax=Aaosphaeria arxii CBS 175.79 TaxID=1450172 RepID=A0A6A5XBM2_9PLEO|nr:uncharacterized protein BU24DRAFT_467649 [Aaosphaeria arxii CBS 175.79]KAF2010174.1 hypothetical protein BU24DRAFT_467649 [Aaosphaeria arxii CBS 175.79]